MSMCRLMDAVMTNRWRRRRSARNNKHIRITITIQCFSEAEFSEALKKPGKPLEKLSWTGAPNKKALIELHDPFTDKDQGKVRF